MTPKKINTFVETKGATYTVTLTNTPRGWVAQARNQANHWIYDIPGSGRRTSAEMLAQAERILKSPVWSSYNAYWKVA